MRNGETGTKLTVADLLITIGTGRQVEQERDGEWRGESDQGRGYGRRREKRSEVEQKARSIDDTSSRRQGEMIGRTAAYKDTSRRAVKSGHCHHDFTIILVSGHK